MQFTRDANVIVGFDMNDDAGVYRLSDEMALVQTLDFFTPIVDDPYLFGQIAVANGLSDVYAMGGRPLTAMNIVCFPSGLFSLKTLGRILQGGQDKCAEAGVQLLGGHSVEDAELKYGVSITGIIHPSKVLKNHGLKAGDRIILTKPLGTGVLSTVIKAGQLAEPHQGSLVKSMVALNDVASRILQNYNAHACTDVTGFGLMGHLLEMLARDELEVVVDSSALPLLPGAIEWASAGLIPAGMYRNRDFVGQACTVAPSVRREIADITFDPQTSGGLLFSLPDDEARLCLSALHDEGIAEARIVAVVESAPGPRIRLV